MVCWIIRTTNVTTNRLLCEELGTSRGRVCRLEHAHDALAVVACPAQQQSLVARMSPRDDGPATVPVTAVELAYAVVAHSARHHEQRGVAAKTNVVT